MIFEKFAEDVMWELEKNEAILKLHEMLTDGKITVKDEEDGNG
jgi:hypothetical protein